MLVALFLWAILAAVAAAPIAGQIVPRFGPGLVPTVALAVLVMFLWPRLEERLTWRGLVLATFVLSAAWAVALASMDGWDALSAPVRTRYEYLADVPAIDSPGAFLRTFVDRIDTFALHVRGHPPGMLLLLWGLDRVGPGGAGWATALMVAGGAAAIPAALVALREVGREATARAAAPFLAVAPAAVWIATSADAAFAGVSAWGVALFVLGTGRRGLRSDLLSFAGGALLGISLFLSYGLVLVGIVPLAIALARRRLRPLVLATVAVGAVLLAFGAMGFWWPDGLRASMPLVRSTSAHRSYLLFLLFNLCVFAVLVGPAVAVGLAGRRERGTWLLVGSALLAVAVADLSGMSKGEVERIWLPFFPWVALAASALVADAVVRRRWLGLQAAAAIAVQALFLTPW
jgi:methylthioxylose transferase